MPAPPSRAQTDAKNAAQKSSVSPAGGKGGTSSSKSSPSSGGMKSGPGATGGAKTPGGTTAKTSTAQKTSTSQTKSTVARSVPGTSQAAAKNTALGRAAESAKQNLGPISASNAAVPGFRAGFGGPLPAVTRNPISTSNMGQGPAVRPTQKTNWQNRPGAMVMGSPASKRAMDPKALGLPKQATTAMQRALDPQVPPAKTVNYLDTAASAIGLNESDKKAALQSYLRDGGVNLDPATTAWCAAFVNATLQKAGLPGTGSLMARSFLKYGTPTEEPKPGDIAVFSRGAAPFGHVGFYQGMTPDGKYVKVLGGNQANAVNVKNYPASRILGYRQVPGESAIAGPGLTPSATPTQVAGPAMAPPAAPVRNQALQAVAGGLTQPTRLGPFQGPRMPGDSAAPQGIPTQLASAALGSIPRPRPRPTMAPVPRPTPRPDSFPRGFGDTGIGRTVNSYSPAPPVPNMRPDTFPSGFGDTGIGRTVNQYTPPSFGDQGMGRTVNPYSQPAPPVPTARPDSFPRGFNDQGMGRPVNPYSAPVSPFSDAGIRKPVSPFAGQPPASIVPPIPKARPPMQGPPRPIGGMSFTPGLPDAQKRYYDRVAQTPGPQQPYSLPGYPGAQPAGTYTAPYDRAPRMSPFGNVGQEYHEHSAPPTPSQYRNETPPAAPNMGTPASQTAQTETEPSFWEKTGDMFNQASTAVTEKLAENKKMVEEIEKKVGPLTPAKVKMWSWLNGLSGGGTADTNFDNNRSPHQMVKNTAPAYGGAPSQPPAAESDYTPADLIALKSRMVAAGASPEEIAFVDSLINQTA
jgi:uncharacterized protein (TIGR02594 family)